MENLIYKNEIYQIVGACMEVHSYFGHGFLEVVYKDAVEIEFLTNAITYEREKAFQIKYKERLLLRKFNVDFFMMQKIIVEIKSTKEGLSNEYIKQTLNYLKVSGCKLGLIVNFGKSSLEYKRLIF